jgi:hypothetical protein
MTRKAKVVWRGTGLSGNGELFKVDITLEPRLV